jgi:LEA14-like dessication related protein
MKIRTIVAVSVAVIVVLGAAGAVFFLTLQAPQVENVSVISIDNVSSSGFNLTFVVRLYNPNVVGVSIKSLTYNLLLVNGNRVLSRGTIDGVQIPARASVEIPILSTINFGPVISAAFQTIFSKSVMMDLSGVVIAHPLFTDVKISFDRTFDAYPYITNALSKAL